MPGMKRPKLKQYILNYRKDPYDERDFLYQQVKSSTVDEGTKLSIPAKMDWTSSMSPVRDQGR